MRKEGGDTEVIKTRLYYRLYPIDYVNELNQKGIKGRKKSMAFLIYWHDMEMGHINSVAFYADLWGLAKSTAHKWIIEFTKEAELFLQYWHQKNFLELENDINIPKKTSKKSERKTNDYKAHKYRESVNPNTESERKTNQVINNIYDDDNIIQKLDKKFNELYSIYRTISTYAGNKKEAFKEWSKIRDKINYEDIKRAVILYLHDPSVIKRYNLANFLKNEVYLFYMPKRLKVKVQGMWITGTYKEQEEIFIADDGEPYKLTQERLAELFSKRELEFV